MRRKYIVILVVAVVGYIIYRKFGSQIANTVTNITK